MAKIKIELPHVGEELVVDLEEDFGLTIEMWRNLDEEARRNLIADVVIFKHGWTFNYVEEKDSI